MSDKLEPTSAARAVIEHLQSLDVPVATAERIVEDLGATSIEDLKHLTAADLSGVGLKAIPSRKLLAALAPETPTTAPSFPEASLDLLPNVPEEDSWLEELRTGGVLKVQQSTVISAIRAALAHRAGLYTVPGKLVALMEKFAEEMDEPVDPIFFKLRRQLTRQSYGNLFDAIGGLDGTYVTQARKQSLLRRINQHLWPAISSFNRQLTVWQETWAQGSMSPAALASLVLGRDAGVMPAGASMTPPSTGVLHDHAGAVNDAINLVFKGTGAQIASALAYEATGIRRTFADSRLCALTGSANREQMILKLGVRVSAADPRLEKDLIRFVLGIIQSKDQPAGDQELRFFNSLYMLGAQISWDQLGGAKNSAGAVTGIGDRL